MTVRARDSAALKELPVSWDGRAANVLALLSRLALEAKRDGNRISIADAPEPLATLLHMCGLAAPSGPIEVGLR